MRFFNRLAASVAIGGLLLATAVELGARTKKGDKFLKEGRKAQLAEEWDRALDLYEQALAEDPSDPTYQMAVRRTRFTSGQSHLKVGRKLRKQNKLTEALAQFQKAYVIDPSSTIAAQEIRATYQMIKQKQGREKKGKAGKEEDEYAGLTPAERAFRQAEKRLSSLEPVPTLRPIKRYLSTLKMNNQSTKVLYETVGKLAGINVVFDPEFQPPPKKQSIDLSNTTLEEALRYLSVLTKTYWKPLSKNTIFVTNDNLTKRRDYEDMVVQIFYLKNVTKQQEVQEISTAVRSLTDMRRVFVYNSQNAILVRGTRDQVALAEKVLHDLDKPLSEVVVDVLVMEANRTRTRDLAATIMSAGKAGLSLPLAFTPKNPVPLPGSGSSTTGTNGSGGTKPTPGGINLGRLGTLGPEDWSVSLPGALLQALMEDRTTKILQRPQLRAADGQKASLKLGDRYPYATGSFQPGVGSVGVSPLVSTQFQFADVGVNVDLTPKIHGADEVSMHIEIEISAVREQIDVGGLSQPVIGQRKIAEDIRVRDGEVTLLGGLTQDQVSNTKAGVPGLADIPIIKWFGFSSQSKKHTEGELLIALIPHIVRRPEITAENLRGIAAGSDQAVRLRYEEPAIKPEPSPAAAKKSRPAPAAPVPGTPPAPKPAAPGAPGSKPAVPGAPAVMLRFNPGAVQAKPGEKFTVALTLENGTDIFNAPMRIHFDPKLLRLTEVSRGGLLSGDGKQVIFSRNILNDSGDASIVLNRLPGAGGVSGTGTLVTLTFEATGTGATRITLPSLTIRDSQMRPLPATSPSLPVTIQQAP